MITAARHPVVLLAERPVPRSRCSGDGVEIRHVDGTARPALPAAIRDADALRVRSATRFAAEWVAEDEAGRPNFTRLQKEGAEHPIEEVGEKLRGLMSWVGSKAT